MSKKFQGLRFQHNQQPHNAQTLPIGKKQHLMIERFAHDGRGITTLQGKTWFVTGALPEEEVEARVLSGQGKIVNAKCERVFHSSPLRQTPPCPYTQRCGGCDLQHITYEEQVKLKQASVNEQFQRLANIHIEQWQPPLISKPFGYRRRTRIAVRHNAKNKQLDIGFRAAYSQQIIPVKNCLVLTDSLRPLLQKLAECLHKLKKPQCIGHLELFSGNQNALLIRHTTPLFDEDTTLLFSFCQTNGCQLWLQGKDNPAPYLSDQHLNYSIVVNNHPITLDYRMGNFIQVNPEINQLMINQALDWLQLKTDDAVLDLFSGFGNFTLPMALQTKKVIAVEVVKSMVEEGQKNAEKNNIHNVQFHQFDLSQPIMGNIWATEKFSAILLDPPRDGAAEIIKQMKRLDTNRILYVSCKPATLARDSKLLIEQGYKIKKIGIIDMFPQTSHVETMVLFER